MRGFSSIRILLVLAVLYGVYTVLCQVLFMRELFIVVRGNELLIGVFFFSWFVGVMSGAQVSSRLADRLKSPLQTALFFLGIQILITPGIISLIRFLRLVFRIPPGEYIPLVPFWLATILTLFPFSFFTGFNFPLLCGTLAQMSRSGAFSIGRIYTADSLGSIIGGVAFSLFLVHMLSPLNTVFVFACLVLAISFLLSREKVKINRLTRIWIGALTVLFLACLLTPLGGLLEKGTAHIRWRSFAPGFEFIDDKETPYQHLSLAKREDQYSLLSNGSFVSSFPDPYATAEEVHFIMTVAPRIQNILILGGGNPQILPEILKYPVKRIDYVEMDARLLPFLMPHLTEEVSRAMKDSRVYIHHEDGRRFVRRLGAEPASNKDSGYDLIWVDLPEPSTAEDNRFYTTDFYAEARVLMSSQGILVTGCTSAVNYFGETVSDYIQSIYKSLRMVFEEVKVTPGVRMLLFASPKKDHLTLDTEVLAERFQSREISTPYFSPYLFSTLLDPFQVNFTQKAIDRELSKAKVNTDLHPISYLFNLRLWARQSGSLMEGGLGLLGTLRFGYVCVFILLILAGSLIFIRIKRSLFPVTARFTILYILTTTGACGMAIEVLLLYLFQNIYGCLYEKIGLFIASFMTGIVLGAEIVTRRLKEKEISWRQLKKGLEIVEGLYWFFFMVTAFMISWWTPTELVFYLMVFIGGLLTGVEFPLGGQAYLSTGARVGRTSGRIDVADHLGAAFGALLIGIVLVPSLGILYTLFILALVKLTALTLVYRIKRPISA